MLRLLLTSALSICLLTTALAGQTLSNDGTVNQTDQFGRKQGHWVLTADMLNVDGYATDAIVEEGSFQDDMRQGIWKRFYPNGQMRNEIFYAGNIPTGEYKVYYENGQVQEHGTWSHNKNIGSFTRFYENGAFQQKFEFTENGKRNGKQLYYHENGQLSMEVTVVNGIENGVMVRYNEAGEKTEERTFDNGRVKPGSTKKYGNKAAPVQKVETPKDAVASNPEPEGISNRAQAFDGNGFNTLYNKNNRVTQIGEFKNGKLWDGKWNRYNGDGILVRVDIYKGGRFVGNGQIEEYEK